MLYEIRKVYKKIKYRLLIRILDISNAKDLSVADVLFLEFLSVIETDITIQDFARQIKMPPSSLSYTLNSLEKKGYIERVQNKDDKRKFTIKISPKYEKELFKEEKYIRMLALRLKADIPIENQDTYKTIIMHIDDEI